MGMSFYLLAQKMKIEDDLQKKGYQVISCYEIDITKPIKTRILLMLKADFIVTLENWWKDTDCKTEVEIARKLSIPVHHFTKVKNMDSNILKVSGSYLPTNDYNKLFEKAKKHLK